MRTVTRHISTYCRQVNYSITYPHTRAMPSAWQTISLLDINGNTISRLFIDFEDMTYDINVKDQPPITLPL